MCLGTKSFERFDYCLPDEYCIGPDNPEDSIPFTRDTFCKKGKIRFHNHSTIKKKVDFVDCIMLV